MTELRNLIRRMWWHGIDVEVIAITLEIDVTDVESFLFTRVPDHQLHFAAGSSR